MRCADFPGHIRGDGHVPGRRFGTPILVSCATLTHVWLQTLVDEFGFGAVVELASDSSNVVDALMTGLRDVLSTVRLTTDDDPRVDSITPIEYTGVTEGSVDFNVTFNGCADCDRGTQHQVELKVCLFGESDVTLTQSVDLCTATPVVEEEKVVSWGGWVERDRAGSNMTLEDLDDMYAGLPDPHRGQVPWWVAESGDVRLQAIASVGVPATDEPINTALHLVAPSADDPAVATQTFDVDFTNVLPLALRGYTKANGVTNVGSSTAFAVTMSLVYEDGSEVEDVISLSSASGTFDWDFQVALFMPSQVVSSITLRARLADGAQGEAWFAGLGVVVMPTSACSCDPGFYATLSSSIGSGASVNPAAIEGATRCSRCPFGFACSGSSLTQCLTGTYSYGGYTMCHDCLPGRTCINGTIMPCLIGWYLSGNNTCSICPTGSACSGGLKEDCPAGFYTPIEGSEFCLPCLPGTFSNTTMADSCVPCEAGTTANSGATVCYPCGFGEMSGEGEHPCTVCPPGRFAASQGSTSCEDCPIGTYSDVPSSRTCLDCPSGTTTSSSGATNATWCEAMA